MEGRIRGYFSERIFGILEHINESVRSSNGNIIEIRLRLGKPLVVSVLNKIGSSANRRVCEYFVGDGGIIVNSYRGGAMIVNARDIDYSFRAICEYSVHSFSKELSQGYITIQGGHRVGICGTAVGGLDIVSGIKNISGLNFRIAQERFGSADEIMGRVYKKCIESSLIIGVPMAGKTTILRDLCRQLGNIYNLSIIDERGEIAAVYQGEAQNDVGVKTDVFNGYPKGAGMLTAIRVMSPAIIAIDEIGCLADCIAIEQTFNAGVAIIATAHGGSISEIKQRQHIRRLLDQGIFSNICVLGSGENLGRVMEIRRWDEV